MPIGFALANGRFRKIIDKNSIIPLVKSFRLPPPKEPGAAFIELDIFQGDSELIVDNEYLGTVRVPASAAGKKIDFKLDEECLLKIMVEEGGGTREVALATRDTPESLKKALEEDRARREQQQGSGNGHGAAAGGGLFKSIRRILGGG
jgi:molecular chaperone DnaK